MRKPVVLLAAALLGACATSPPRSPETMIPEQQINGLVEEYFDRQLELSPMAATSIGDTRFDDRLDETTSPGFRERQIALDQAFLDRARRIDPTGLPATARITYDIFVSERELALEGRDFPEELMPLNQMNGLPMDLAVYGSGTGPQPFATAKDYDRFLKRVRQFPRWVDGAIEQMRAGMARGVTVPRPAMSKVVAQLRGIVTANLSDNIFWAPVAAIPQDISAKDRDRIADEYKAAITKEVLPAYTRLADFIEKDYLPASRTTVGWADLPDGQAWYRWRIRGATTMDMPAEEIHQLGLSEVARIRGEMLAVKNQVGFKGDLDAFFKFLEEDPQFYFKTNDELLNAYRAVKVHIDALLPKLFADFPKADYEIRPVEAFREES
ncbi:MAG: DUF885 domain-containing protein, partial [Peristeroidobacter soli]